MFAVIATLRGKVIGATDVLVLFAVPGGEVVALVVDTLKGINEAPRRICFICFLCRQPLWIKR
ncbi:MAG: hypothetical protein JZU64_01215 [Rhodoferax sp.]|jgi:hypothetical protein|nr:hypothetical protein [Rhodoferax sp.]